MKPIARGTLLLAVGLVLGWMLRGARGRLAQARSQPIQSVAQASQIIARANLAEKSANAEPVRITPTDRVKSLAELSRHGHTQFFVNVVAGSKLDPGFIEMYGLSETEVAALNTSLAAARNRLAELELGFATAQTDDEKQELSVHVPPFPEAGGVVHDQVIAAFKATLGPQRYDAFNVLSANGFESAFNGFGLNDTTYVMKLVPSGPAFRGDLPYVIQTKYSSAATGFSGTSGSNLTASTIADFFPTLAHFIPPALIPLKK